MQYETLFSYQLYKIIAGPTKQCKVKEKSEAIPVTGRGGL
jgi:hypothetical protein